MCLKVKKKTVRPSNPTHWFREYHGRKYSNQASNCNCRCGFVNKESILPIPNVNIYWREKDALFVYESTLVHLHCLHDIKQLVILCIISRLIVFPFIFDGLHFFEKRNQNFHKLRIFTKILNFYVFVIRVSNDRKGTHFYDQQL